LRLVHLYADKESPKFEKAALRWLRRYLNEASPELSDVAKVVAELDQRVGRTVCVNTRTGRDPHGFQTTRDVGL
jgi:hypothetical protein